MKNKQVYSLCIQEYNVKYIDVRLEISLERIFNVSGEW